ncbi:hypothetical protein Moror_12172 [Moniliophthora roreri MCA 2997]|uniref:Uncharacterized protein n=1 Tax=Moniliophthora roreri (strain MCA 2997) TaxID=1381753 RepID=V2W6G2_MONRO|nr:hypothetical protein Moror_12172 [Moniliophthora roreri MCA 2997]
MIVRCSYIAFIRSPTPQNIETIQIVADMVEVESTGFIFDLRKEIFADHPQLWGTSATFHKASWDKRITVVCRALKGKALDEYADELYLDDIIHEVFGVAADEILPQWSLIVCFEHSNQLAVAPATIVGQLKWDFKKYTKAVISGRSPSITTKSTNYNENQASDAALLDGHFNAFGKATTALPIELYHPAFANFSSNAHDSNLQVPDDVLCTTAKLIRQLSAIRVSGSCVGDNDFLQTLSDILGVVIDTPVGSSDYMSKHPTPMNINAATEIIEIQSDSDIGGADLSVQVSFVYARFYCQENRTRLWIVILSAVMTSHTIVQHLSGFEWFGCSCALDNEQVINLGRLLYALCLGIAELKQYYSNLAAPTVIPRHTVNFSYVKPLEPEVMCAIFQAKLLDREDAGKLVVIKFVKQYCAAAHIWLAERGFAP